MLGYTADGLIQLGSNLSLPTSSDPFRAQTMFPQDFVDKLTVGEYNVHADICGSDNDMTQTRQHGY